MHGCPEGLLDEGRDTFHVRQKSRCMCYSLFVNLTHVPIAEVSKVPDAQVGWTWFEEDIVQRYNIILEGWTAGSIMDPSKLSISQTVICRLLEAVQTGECMFRKLGHTEAAK
jgi:hypothetical protein